MTSSSVEMAVAAFALMKGMVRVVQAAMLGAILNNLLLVRFPLQDGRALRIAQRTSCIIQPTN
jgi:hypothetical protein